MYEPDSNKVQKIHVESDASRIKLNIRDNLPKSVEKPKLNEKNLQSPKMRANQLGRSEEIEEKGGVNNNPFPRLIRISGKKLDMNSTLVQCTASSLNKTEAFILDTGKKFFQFNGLNPVMNTVFERNRANEIINALNEEREGKCEREIIDFGHDNAEFWSILGGKLDNLPMSNPDPGYTAELFVLSDESGEIVFKSLAKGRQIKKNLLRSDDVMILDTGFNAIVWEGKKSNKNISSNAAKKYISEFGRNKNVEVKRCMEGDEIELFHIYTNN
jgi:hypothetical protein